MAGFLYYTITICRSSPRTSRSELSWWKPTPAPSTTPSHCHGIQNNAGKTGDSILTPSESACRLGDNGFNSRPKLHHRLAKDVECCIYCCFISEICDITLVWVGGILWPSTLTGETHYYAQWGLPNKDCAIKGLNDDCNTHINTFRVSYILRKLKAYKDYDFHKYYDFYKNYDFHELYIIKMNKVTALSLPLDNMKLHYL